MDYLDIIAEEQAALNEAMLSANDVPAKKTPAAPSSPNVDTFCFLGLYRTESGWCRLLADSEKRQIKLERLTE